jgi:hypothetical protein
MKQPSACTLLVNTTRRIPWRDAASSTLCMPLTLLDNTSSSSVEVDRRAVAR